MKTWCQHYFSSLMTQRPWPRTLAVLVTAVILLVSLSTGVLAHTLSNAPQVTVTYYACVINSNGNILALTTSQAKCPNKEQKIQWNQLGPQGPAGPQGVQGPVGPQGPQGPTGLSQGYGGIGGSVVQLSSSPQSVGQVQVGAVGNYLVVATANVIPTSADIIACYIAASDGTIGHFTAFTGASLTGYATLAITDTLSLNAAGTINLECYSENGDSNSVIYYSSVSAVQLNTLSTQAPVRTSHQLHKH